MDGFRILMEAAKKKRKSIDTTKAKHPKIGFPGYAFGSNPGDRPNETKSFHPSLGPDPAMPDATEAKQQDSGVIEMTPGTGSAGVGSQTGGGSVGPVVALTGGAPCGESVEAQQIGAILESFKKNNPTSDIINEIQNVFEGIKQGNGVLYHSCDGISTMNKSSEVPATCESQVAALSAACEAALNAFREYTGYDYSALH
jgi:hypothetical protein